MYYVNVCNQTDKDLFYKCLEKLKKTKGFKMQDKVLEDVDGSLYAIFKYGEGKVILKNDEEIGALFIESDNNIENVVCK
ncbi:hypothetical protein [Sporanaerobacter acetigenes]|uniref:Uncharacterized protein n=1 Tax=Sporanaerobacter acetigenes DSM 13106 TaxID=1123281 RepID=A0A1M5U0I6_9FIRM|nr:hypothetical protein [Sporanaerobacter acetigenes]SHH56386.1 hypothetical protein SAMN02745180_00485 [Sporanaerobacter acetigenes DSM 13106]